MKTAANRTRKLKKKRRRDDIAANCKRKLKNDGKMKIAANRTRQINKNECEMILRRIVNHK